MSKEGWFGQSRDIAKRKNGKATEFHTQQRSRFAEKNIGNWGELAINLLWKVFAQIGDSYFLETSGLSSGELSPILLDQRDNESYGGHRDPNLGPGAG